MPKADPTLLREAIKEAQRLGVVKDITVAYETTLKSVEKRAR